MKIVYNREADAFNITLKKGKVARTAEVAPEVLADFDRSGNLLSFEVIGAREKLGAENFREVAVGRRSIRLPVGVS